MNMFVKIDYSTSNTVYQQDVIPTHAYIVRKGDFQMLIKIKSKDESVRASLTKPIGR